MAITLSDRFRKTQKFDCSLKIIVKDHQESKELKVEESALVWYTDGYEIYSRVEARVYGPK